MINNRSVIAFIPARAGSKGVINKNIYEIEDRPLIAYTIEAAKKSCYVDKVIVSTDSDKIAEISRKYGADVPFVRPKEISDDTAKTIDAVMHAKEYLCENNERFDIFMLLQATSPLRDESDIDSALNYFETIGEKSVVSVSEALNNPILIRSRTDDGKLFPIIAGNSTVRRQDFYNYFVVNGAIYINKFDELSYETSLNDNQYGWILRKDHSLDIDNMEDILKLQKMLRDENGK